MQIFTTLNHLKNADFPDTEKMVIDDFERLFIEKDLTFCTNDTKRMLMLKKACNFPEFNALKLNDGTTSFIHNMPALLNFLQELSMEKVSIDKIKEVDSYKEYQKHMNILKKVKENYLKIIKSQNETDMISFSPVLNETTKNKIKSMKEVVFHHDGIISETDMIIFDMTSKLVPTKLIVDTTEWNTRAIKKISKFGKIKANKRYIIDISNQKIEDEINLKKFKKPTSYTTPVISLGILDIKHKIKELLKKGVSPKEITCLYTSYEDKRLMELHMSDITYTKKGLSFADLPTGKLLNAIIELGKKSVSLNEYNYNTLLKGTSNYIAFHRMTETTEIDTSFIEKTIQNWNNPVDSEEFIEILNSLSFASRTKEEMENFENIIKQFEDSQHFSNNETLGFLFSLFSFVLSRKGLTGDDEVNLNKVEAFSLYDARGVQNRYLFIIGFEDEKVPFPVKKDLFLNTDVREHANLPTSYDRVGLQKHYWENMIRENIKTVIYSVDNETSSPSIFLNEIGVKNRPISKTSTKQAAKEISSRKRKRKGKTNFSIEDIEIKEEDNFFNKKISASKLNTWLTCKRKYFYKYVANMNRDVEISLVQDKREYGIIIHSILEDIFVPGVEKQEKEITLKQVLKRLDILPFNTSIDKYEIDAWKRYLNLFVEREYERFKNGWKIVNVEKKINTKIGDIEIEGIVDRIDEHDDGSILIIDYKSGRVPKLKKIIEKEVDFQPEFYKILVNKEFPGEEIDFKYYELKTQELVAVSEPKKRLEYFINQLPIWKEQGVKDYSKTALKSDCKYCQFKDICH